METNLFPKHQRHNFQNMHTPSPLEYIKIDTHHMSEYPP